MTNFTPGPWRLGRQFHVGKQVMVVLETEDGKRVICHLAIPIPNPNANLIAAAPELLEALQALQPILWNDGPLVAAYKDVEAKVDAAIAKATGEQS
jgi:hypothetical protein